MQLNMDCNCPKPHFGALKIDPKSEKKVKSILAARFNSSDFDKLGALSQRAEKLISDVTLFAPKGKNSEVLSVSIKDAFGHPLYVKSENFISSLTSPIRFIRKAVDVCEDYNNRYIDYKTYGTQVVKKLGIVGYYLTRYLINSMSKADWLELGKIADKRAGASVQVYLAAPASLNRLTADIVGSKPYSEHFHLKSAAVPTKKSPMKFIKKMVKIADKLEKKDKELMGNSNVSPNQTMSGIKKG